MASRATLPGLEQLDAVQRQVAAAADSVLLLGAAGTGKTTALVNASVSAARRHGVPAVLALARNRDAVRHWQADAARALGAVAPQVATVAALAGTIVADASRAVEPPRILTAPEQEMRVRELLRGSVETGSVPWPAEWKPALGTRAFAGTLRRCLAHARRLGWEPQDLARLAAERGDAGWEAVATFLGEYLQVLDWEGALDHVEVVLRAARIVAGGAPTRYDGLQAIVADDVHEWDVAQARLILGLARSGARLVVAADPDQCTGSYRGGDLAALTLVREHVGASLTCPVLYRGGSAARDARRSLMGERWYPGLPASAASGHRAPAVVGTGPARVVALEFDDGHVQALHLAQLLRGRHAAGVAWRDMAVLASSPRSEIPLLARGLAQAGIPIFVPTADVALSEQPAVATLVAAARLALGTPAEDRDAWPDQVFERLLTSDLAGVAPRSLRRLQRWLRSSSSGEPSGSLSHPGSAPLGRGGEDEDPANAVPRGLSLRRLAADPDSAQAVPEDLRQVVAAIRRLDERLLAARAAQARDATPAEILWELWTGVCDDQGRSWPERISQRAAGSGERALAADRDLDAVIQLFRLAERAPQRWGGRRALGALLEEIEYQEIPAEPDVGAQPRVDRVEVLSLHRARGRSWRFAIVSGLTASVWDSGELSAGIAPPERLTETELLPMPPRQRTAEQRRLFNVALSRGDDIVLAACGGPSDPPTAYLSEAGLDVVTISGPPGQPQTAVDVMLRLRAEAAAAGESPVGASPSAAAAASGCDAAAGLRVLLAARDARGVPLFRGMSPQHWPGALAWTVAPRPLRRSGPLTLSGSAVAALSDCPMRWFLQREAGADRPSGVPAQFGLIVHAAAAALARDAGRAGDVATLLAESWTGTGYEAAWQEARERARAGESLHRALEWLASRSGELAAEVPVDQAVPVIDEHGEVVDQVRIKGSVDLIETTGDERLVWDYKTARVLPSIRDAAADPQLAVYQLALREQPGSPVAGAGLVHLCVPESRDAGGRPATRHQPGVDTDAGSAEHAMSLVRRAAAVVRNESFPPRPGKGCRTCPFRASCPAESPRAWCAGADPLAVTP